MIKKPVMKTLVLKCAAILLVTGLVFTACKKSSQSFESNGAITANILYACNNCPGGGYLIKFTTDTNTYYISNSLTPFGITRNTKLPVDVSVNWKPDNTASAIM